MGKSLNIISGRLKEARYTKGYRSARLFSTFNNIAESTYAQHESGKRKLNINTLIIYSAILSVNPSWILTGQGTMELPDVSDTVTSPRPITNFKNIKVNLYLLTQVIKMLIPYILNKNISNSQSLLPVIYDVCNKSDSKSSASISVDQIIKNTLSDIIAKKPVTLF